ncbi:hypothetical protein [Streptomyces camelliae]|uniref:Uncharacterized protein n=1 Tax=Streptomyces camelliae TaxID=3004093 RepID=A0ABY7P4D1_9ACTN|nr:hypothetical protein [Streptomyces sp. HUAS 2-6]WBO64562.1 hypothetical protein O1G22_17825 [Streptomyces sp. HUAS 2-6]
MAAEEFDPRTDRAFLAWARAVCDELWLGLGETRGSNDFLEFLGKIFTDNGELPAEHLAPLVQRRRIELAERYMRLFIGQARRETGLAVAEALCSSPPDDREPTGLTQVGDSVIRAIREPDVAVETAEAVQDYVMARYRTVWPVCPVHRIGFHPVSADDAPAWECSAGEHRVPMLDSR